MVNGDRLANYWLLSKAKATGVKLGDVVGVDLTDRRLKDARDEKG